MAEENQTIFNFDGAQLYLIFQLKNAATINLSNWNLDEAYWKLRDLRREIDPILKTTKPEEYLVLDEKGEKIKIKLTEREMVEKLLEILQNERNDLLSSSGEKEDFSRFYTALEEFYLILNRIMKERGLLLREGDDAGQAFMRR